MNSAAAVGFVIHLGLLVVVGFEAADEERLADRQSLHEGVQRLTELAAQRRHLFMVVTLCLCGQQWHNVKSAIQKTICHQ